jgi:thioredoxin reductase (NADPH)
VDYRRRELSNEKRFMGAGLDYGAGASEAAVCTKDDDVYIAGGGNSAGQAALFFSRAARSVTMIVLCPCLKETLSQ